MNYTRTDYRQGIAVEIVERVLQIEYWKGVPHAVVTISPDTFRGASYYDFDPRGGDKDDLMFYESGGGPNQWEFDCHSLGNSGDSQLWIDPEFRPRMRLNLINVTMIREPLMLNAETDNPFEFGQDVGDITYCNACGLHYDEDYCPIHDCEFTEGAEEEWAARQALYEE